MTRGLAVAAVLLAAAVGVAGAGDEVGTTFAAPFERVWPAAQEGLRAEGWSIERADRPLGMLVTTSRRLQGDAGGVHVRARRVSLDVRVVAVAEARTSVTVASRLVDRERLLWMERDEGVVDADALAAASVERRVLAAIGKAL